MAIGSAAEGLLQRLERRRSLRLSGDVESLDAPRSPDVTGCSSAVAAPDVVRLDFLGDGEPGPLVSAAAPNPPERAASSDIVAPNPFSQSLDDAPVNVPPSTKPAPEPGGEAGHDRLHPELLTMDALKDWMNFFGCKAASSREFMVKRLREIDAYLHDGAPADGPASVEAVTAARPTRGRPKKRARNQADAAGEAAPPASAGLEAGGGRPKKVASSQSPEAREALPAVGPRSREGRRAEKTERIEQLLEDTIRKDTELHERLLLFEAVELSELRDRVGALEPELLGVGEQRLRTFLDARGFIFANSWAQHRGSKWSKDR